MFTIVIYDGQDGHYVGTLENVGHERVVSSLSEGDAVEVFFDGNLVPRFWGHGFRTDDDGFAIPTGGQNET
jgi:hypothetical protein